MTLVTAVKEETNLAGVLQSQLTATGLSFTAVFYDTKTGQQRTPQATTLTFTLDKDSKRAERIRCDSHSTDPTTGITTGVINASGRSLPMYGTGAGSGTGLAHEPSASIGCVTNHEASAQIFNWMEGNVGSGGNSLRVGDETAGNKTIYAQNADANKPFLRYDDTSNVWVFSNDGLSSTAMGNGASVYTAGDGLTLTASDFDIDLTDTTIFTTTSAAGRVPVTLGSGKLDQSILLYGTEITQSMNGLSANVTAANLNTLTGEGDAGILHTHSGIASATMVAGETLVAGDVVYIKGMEIAQLTADQDAKVEHANPNTNFETDTTMEISVAAGASTEKRAYVHFDISAQPASVEKAYLRIFTSSATSVNSTSRALQAYLPTGAFSEATLTWNNQPGINSGVSALSVADIYTTYGSGLGIFFDVTTIYNTHWSANNYGVRIQWDDETTGAVFQVLMHSSESASSNLRPQLVLVKTTANYGRVYKTASNAQAAGAKGIVVSGGAAGANVLVAFDGVIAGLTGLTPYALYKAGTSGAPTLATDSLDAQFLAISATQLKVLDKRKEYSTDTLSITQSLGDFDILVSELPAGMILDNVVATTGDTFAYSYKGYATTFDASPSSGSADDMGITALDIL